MQNNQSCVIAYVQEHEDEDYRLAVVSTISTAVLLRTDHFCTREEAQRLSYEAPFFTSVQDAQAFLEEVCDATILST